MKKLILIFCFVLISSGAFAQIFFDENFNYPAGDSLGAHGWITNSGGSLNRIFVTSPGLTYPGYALSGIGNATTLTNTGQDQYNLLSDSIYSGSVYAAFMVRLDTVKSGDYFLALLQTGSTSFYEGRVNVRLSAGNINFGITKGNASTDLTVPGIWSTTAYSLNTTYLVVLKYTFVPAGANNDQVSLFVFSSGVPATEPATPTIGPITYASLDAISIGRVALRQGTASSSPSVGVDGIRVMTSWFPTLYKIKLAIQGIFDSTTVGHTRRDTAVVYLHDATTPYNIVDSATSIIDSVTLTGNFAFANAPTGTYYLEARYRKSPVFRNGINTWSKTGGQSFTQGIDGTYDFTTAASQAFGNNEKLVGSTYVIYNGDPTLDGTISLPDIVAVFNSSASFSTGYLNTDINGDRSVTLTDIIITFNNSAGFVHQILPPL